MVEYNKNDVGILEETYVRLRPFIKNHPNVALYVDCEEPLCRNCGSEDLNWNGFYPTPANKYLAFRCNGCGAIGRSKTSALSKSKRKNLTQ